MNMDELDPCDIDDCGHAEYDQDGRIIYPFTFNEGFMRHRHYNWDIELLSPDWKQIDSGIKACAEECFSIKAVMASFGLSASLIYSVMIKTSRHQPFPKAHTLT